MTGSISLAKNTALVAISKISTQLIVFLMLPLYTAVLRAEDTTPPMLLLVTADNEVYLGANERHSSPRLCANTRLSSP